MKQKMHKHHRYTLFALAGLGLLSPVMVGVLVLLALNLEWLSQERIGLMVSVFALVMSIYVAFFSGFISWKALVFGALPRIDVNLCLYGLSGKTTNYLVAGKPSMLRFKLKNIGWWYAKPASTNTKCYVNVDPAFDLKHANYGGNLELCENEVRHGRDSNYLIVRGIHLYAGECEDIEVAVIAPAEPGTYNVWITAICDQCDHGTFQFPTKVVLEDV